ncbi:hypothetical protein [Providencia phage PSTCR5]|uniref:Uncharacterized protein n=1 Tax=Providencia phage PSTCR5 TaxID=2783547 RepID=A0A873WHU0_9CAUD|nr:receptor binding tail protein [Providencia phage PSTCR5]QPB12143.1 hypothetical protein [Providencia phage PSTCR5]
MGFYAKGSPGTVLHLTESSDARNGVGNDTIFHSSMPHVFITDEWTIPLTNFDASAVGDTYGGWNILGKYKVGSLPAGAINAIKNSSTVTLIEVFYTVNGKEYSKVINGHSITSSFDTGDAWDDWDGRMDFHDYDLHVTMRPGIGVHVGFFVGNKSTDIRQATLDQDSFGINTMRIGGDSEANSFNVARDRLWRCGYNNSFVTIDTSKFYRVGFYGGTYSGILVPPFNNLIGAPRGALANASQKFEKDMQHYSDRDRYANWWLNHRKLGTISGTTKWHGNRNASYMELWDYPTVTFTKIIIRKLNLTYNVNSGYSLTNIVPLTGEIKLDRNDFKVGGVSIKTLAAKMLHQINPSTTGSGYTYMYANPSYDGNGLPNMRSAMPLLGVASDRSINTTSGSSMVSLAPNQHNFLGIQDMKNSGNGWVITPDSIGTQTRTIWGKGGSMALKLLPGATKRVTFGGSEIALANPESKVIATVALGLATNRSSTIIMNLNTTDVRVWLPNEAYYARVGGGIMKLSSNTVPNVGGDHSILVLPINKYVQFMEVKSYKSDSGWADFSDPVVNAWLTNIAFWFRNLGNGNVEISVSHRGAPMPGKKGGNGQSLNANPKFHVPAYTMSIAALS